MCKSFVGDMRLFELERLFFKLMHKFKGFLLKSVFAELIFLMNPKILDGHFFNDFFTFLQIVGDG